MNLTKKSRNFVDLSGEGNGLHTCGRNLPLFIPFFCAPDDAFAKRKRPSTQNVTAAITSDGPSPPKATSVADGAAGDVGGDSEDQPRGCKGARSSRGNSVGDGGGKSDRSSSGSAVSEHSVSVNNAEEGLVEDVDWDNLGSRKVRS